MALAMILQPVKFWLRRIRWPNLALASFCLLAFRTILRLHASKEGVALGLNDSAFIALLLALWCIMGAGYLWNDLDDLTTDGINRPHSALDPAPTALGNVRTAATLLSASGGIFALIAANATGLWSWVWLYPLATAVLMGYTKLLKPLGLAGNVAVALLISLVPMLLLLPEWSWVRRTSVDGDPTLLGVFILFSLLAFFGNLFRELVKDLEDLPGDAIAGIRTLPIRIGITRSLAITFAVGLVLAVFLTYMALTNPWNLDSGPAFLLLALLQGALAIHLLNVKEPAGFRLVSTLAKWHQVAGLLLALGIGLSS